MDSLAVQITKMNLSEEFYFRDVLSNESEFLEETKEKFEKEFNTTAECYNSRKVMALSVELPAAPNVEISTKTFCIDSTLDEYFGQKKTLYKIGWCSSYMIDKRKIASEHYLVEFSWLKISPNRKI